MEKKEASRLWSESEEALVARRIYDVFRRYVSDIQALDMDFLTHIYLNESMFAGPAIRYYSHLSVELHVQPLK